MASVMRVGEERLMLLLGGPSAPPAGILLSSSACLIRSRQPTQAYLSLCTALLSRLLATQLQEKGQHWHLWQISDSAPGLKVPVKANTKASAGPVPLEAPGLWP